MKIGLNFLMQTPERMGATAQERFQHIFRIIEHGNDTGYVSTWFTEHHFSDYGLTPNPLLLLSKASEVAPNLRIGSAVVVLPIWHPMRVAEDIAMLDVISGGRVEFGIGRGYQPYEFNRFGIDLRNNREMFNESLEIILGSLEHPDFEYEGRFWTIPVTTVMPRPLQLPHPPIWMAATSPPTIRQAVQKGYHLMTGTGSTVEELDQRNQYIDYLFQQMGRSSEGIERQATRFVYCSTNPDDVDAAIDETIWQIRTATALNSGKHEVIAGRNRAEAVPYPGEPGKDVWQERLIFGNPDEVIRRLQRHADAGITYIFALFDFGGLPQEKGWESMKLFTKEVMPAVPSIVARPGARTIEDPQAFVVGAAGRYTGA